MNLEPSLDYLASAECFDSLRKDPYWPKWHSPWWHMVLLWELGHAKLIPRAAAQALAESMDRRWLRVWLPGEPGLPEDLDRKRDIGCFCAIGIIEQVLREVGVQMPSWLPDWPLNYVLPDGGVNCDDEAYTGSRRSSFVSTVCVAEAVISRPELSERHIKFLDGAANYLLVRKLFRTSGGDVVDLGWLQPKFPRFYDYDVLRGYRYLERWKKRLGRQIPEEAVAEALKRVAKTTEPPDCLASGESTFPLLEEAIRARSP